MVSGQTVLPKKVWKFDVETVLNTKMNLPKRTFCTNFGRAYFGQVWGDSVSEFCTFRSLNKVNTENLQV